MSALCMMYRSEMNSCRQFKLFVIARRKVAKRAKLTQTEGLPSAAEDEEALLKDLKLANISATTSKRKGNQFAKKSK